ncbi:cob(I)yrinic acid a,c-diamide adenosyltransferase [Pectinatus frisingensis]|uniref:cob(I)yrinic acid a,c-diamide adenosyltransferase n=1 Tax=Pectinatus frisingensis TaxID=865 RepID=UPI0018C5A802|nr:cob(I)yrinic acid a,c-diamide adenosyltransferase [Pectinatus frisingensis]
MLQIYTGSGKGKTTAAIGLSIRAIGAGMRVYFAQFMKSLAYSEQNVLQRFSPQLVLKTSGKPYFIAEEGMIDPKAAAALTDDVVIYPKGNPPADYIKLIEEGIIAAEQAIISQKFDIVILDEINTALFFGLAKRRLIENLLKNVPKNTEIVCTGRNAPDWLIAKADLVTEMKLIKHYYDKGVPARKGIED